MFGLLDLGAKIVGTLFGGSRKVSDTATAVLKTADGVGKWIDNQDFTTQESTELRAKNGVAILDAIKASQNENSVRSVTRRYLAWGITAFTLFWASVGMCFAIAGDVEVVNSMLEVAAKFNLGIAFTSVVSFYFLVNVFRK